MCILHKGERGENRPWEKKITSFVQKIPKIFLKLESDFFKGKIRSYILQETTYLIKDKIPAYKPQGGATIPCLQILNF